MSEEHKSIPNLSSSTQVDSAGIPDGEVVQRSGGALAGTGVTGTDLSEAVAKALGRTVKGIDGNDPDVTGTTYAVQTTDDLVIVFGAAGGEIETIQMPDIDTVNPGQQFSFFIFSLPAQGSILFDVTDGPAGETFHGPNSVSKIDQMYTVEAINSTGAGPAWVVKSSDLEHLHRSQVPVMIQPDSMRLDGGTLTGSFTADEWPSVEFPAGHDVDSALFAARMPGNFDASLTRVLRVYFGFPVNAAAGDELAFRLNTKEPSGPLPGAASSSLTSDQSILVENRVAGEIDFIDFPWNVNEPLMIALARITRRDNDVVQAYASNVHLIGAQIIESLETAKGDVA